MDVVPVPNATISRWTYPPFSGTIDKDGWIWGRGSGRSPMFSSLIKRAWADAGLYRPLADCKNTLMAILGAVEKLLESDHQPER